MALVALRASVLIGALLFVVGGAVGWCEAEPDVPVPALRAHEFAGVVGEWAWLAVAPLLAATVAPYRGRWARWLWLTALPPLIAAVVVLTIDPISLVTFPFSVPLFPTRSPWLLASLAGAALALTALIAIAMLGSRRAVDPLAGRWQVPAVAVTLVLTAVAIPIARGPRDEAMEAKLARQAVRACGPTVATASPPPEVRVECRDRLGREPWCAWETRCPDESMTGGSGPAGTFYGPA